MPSFDLNWAQQPAEQLDSLTPGARRAVLDAVVEIQHDPHGRGTYDKATDRYTADFADGPAMGLIVYIVGEQQLRIVVLRVTVVE